MNSTQLVGRLTADPVLRHTSNGTPVTDIRLAVDRRGDGTDFISVTVWARSAEVVAEHLTRGRRVGVTGRLEQQQWTDKTTGANRERLVVVAESFEFLDSARRSPSAGGTNADDRDDGDLAEERARSEADAAPVGA